MGVSLGLLCLHGLCSVRLFSFLPFPLGWAWVCSENLRAATCCLGGIIRIVGLVKSGSIKNLWGSIFF